MAERTVPFGKSGPGTVSGRVYVERAVVVASWHAGSAAIAASHNVEGLIGEALRRRVKLGDVRHAGCSQYSGIVTYAEGDAT